MSCTQFNEEKVPQVLLQPLHLSCSKELVHFFPCPFSRWSNWLFAIVIVDRIFPFLEKPRLLILAEIASHMQAEAMTIAPTVLFPDCPHPQVLNLFIKLEKHTGLFYESLSSKIFYNSMSAGL